MTRHLLALVLFVGLAAPGLASGDEKVPLPEESHINEQLIAGAAGDILRNTCPQASARMFVVWDKLFMLRQYALDKGYTEDEVKAFLKDHAQKARVKAAAEAYLEAAGAKPGDVASFCQVARDEVAKDTLLGQIISVSE
jgi:hypothetical protein